MNIFKKTLSISSLVAISFVSVSVFATDFIKTDNSTGQIGNKQAGYYSALKLTTGTKACSGKLGVDGYTAPNTSLPTHWGEVKALCLSIFNKTCTANVIIVPASDPKAISKVEECKGPTVASITMYLKKADGHSEGDIIVNSINPQYNVNVTTMNNLSADGSTELLLSNAG